MSSVCANFVIVTAHTLQVLVIVNPFPSFRQPAEAAYGDGSPPDRRVLGSRPRGACTESFVTCGISTSIDDTEDHLILAHLRDKGEVEVLDEVNEMVDNESVVNLFCAEVPMLAEELQEEEEDDVAEEEAEAAAAEEEGGGPAEGGEAGECSNDDDDWWRPGRYDGEGCDQWDAGDDED
ncbi:unnamed protein product [Closterium sp. NIES-53]